MTSDTQTFVIVGAALAGAKAAETLRVEGFEGRVVLIGEEPELPYERPPLSKDYLRGESEHENARVQPAEFYDEHSIELRLGQHVERIDPHAGEVVLDTSDRVGFDSLLLTTGAEPRRIELEGAQLDGVHYLRTFPDSDALRERIGAGGKLAIVGAGWIGSEVAASARQKGLEVTVIEPMSVPLERAIGPEVGAIYRDIHLDHGVDLMLGTGVTAFEGASRVERVRTDSGRTVDCDAVLVAIGVVPRTGLAEGAGLDVENGIRVDGRLETSAPGVYAAGDVASHDHPMFGRLRVEHWANALNQGPAAARSMLGGADPYDRVPYFFSDQYDVGMEYSGHATSWDKVVFRGDPAAREFIAFWLKDGRVLAGMNVNVWDVTDPIQALIRSGEVVDEQRLLDTDVPLPELVST